MRLLDIDGQFGLRRPADRHAIAAPLILNVCWTNSRAEDNDLADARLNQCRARGEKWRADGSMETDRPRDGATDGRAIGGVRDDLPAAIKLWSRTHNPLRRRGGRDEFG